ncbi:MAG: hypothetical protein FJW96_14695 [Actinobacteria bacterium]|nr:hypothetical protein [Actinomycetota bacterium]
MRRRDLRPGTDPKLVHELLFGPVYHRLLFSTEPLRKNDAARIVDAVLDGIAAQPALSNEFRGAPSSNGHGLVE